MFDVLNWRNFIQFIEFYPCLFFLQVRGTHLSLEDRYEHLDKRLTALEKQNEAETAIAVEAS